MIPTYPRLLGASASFVLLALIHLAASGCGSDEIRSYEVPKDGTSSRSATTSRPPAESMPSEGFAPAGPTWSLPEGWQEQPGSGMRFATILMGPGTDAPEIRVTPLAAMAGDPLANVNRWLEQLGKPHIEVSQLGEVMRTVPVGDDAADLVRLTGVGDDPEQILAAILPVDDRVWFFMAMDKQTVLEPLADDFDAFVQGVRMLPPAHPPIGDGTGDSDHPEHPTDTADDPEHPTDTSEHPEHPTDTSEHPTASGEPTPGSSDTVPGLSWMLPAGWAEQAGSSSMRLATFVAGGGAAEVTITRFPGDVGGELANINRWRGQVGMQPIASLADQERMERDIAGSAAAYLDLQGSQRMLVVSVPRGGETWFLKMTGPVDVLGDEKGHFESFVDSVRLPGDPR